MTQEEQRLADDKMRAEIAKLLFETRRNDKEAVQIFVNTVFTPFLAGAAVLGTFIGAALAIYKIFLV